MSSSRSSDSQRRRVEYLRLLRTPTAALTDEERALLVAEIQRGDFATALEVLSHHPPLAPPDVATLLAAKCPVPLPIDRLMDDPHRLTAAIGAEGYREFVARLADRCSPLPAAQKQEDPVSNSLRLLERWVKGGDRFNRVVLAEHQVPPVLGTRRLGLMLLPHSIHDDTECLRVLCDSARAHPGQALRVWNAGRRSGDVELERGVRDLVLDQYQAALKDPEAEGAGEVLGAVRHWAEANLDVPECIDALLGCLSRAHADGVPWIDLEGRLPELLASRVAERALEDGEVLPGAQSVLAGQLATGSTQAWDRFFEVESGPWGSWRVRSRDLLLEGRLPDVPDDQFWVRFGAAWQRACELALQQVALARNALPAAARAQPAHVQDQLLRSHHRDLCRGPTADELIDKVLSRPPCSESARLLFAALRDKPERLDDERISAFAPMATLRSHDELPAAKGLDLNKPLAVTNFLALHGPCGPEHIREVVRGANRQHWWPAWLLDEPWFASILDDGLRQEINDSLSILPAEYLLRLREKHPAWVTEDHVKRAVLNSPIAPDLKVLPEWLDDTLFEMAARADNSNDLRRLSARFRTHSYYRKRFIDLVRERLFASPDGVAAALMGDLLDSASSWEKHGADLVHGLLARNEASLLYQVLLGSEPSARPGDANPDKLIAKIHLAFARGFLHWAEDQLLKSDQPAVERALVSIALLDPPPPFTVDLHKFGSRDGLGDRAKEWVATIHGMVKKGGGREATMRGVWDALSEFRSGGEP